MCKLVLQYKVVLPTLRAGQKNSCTFRNMEVYGDLHARKKKKAEARKLRVSFKSKIPLGEDKLQRKLRGKFIRFWRD